MDIAWNWDAADVVEKPEPDTVDVWLVELTGGVLDHDACWSVLSGRERKRSERYTHDGARAEFVVSRAALRLLLAEYVGVESGDIAYRNAPGGKPFLVEIADKPVPWFNMTHSHGVAIYAISMDQEVGVDVEMVGRKVNAEGVARRFFTEREADRICAESENLKEAFARVWTCKEACLKWSGEGLKGGLKSHEIVFDESWEHPKAVGEKPQPALEILEPGPGWIGAVAVERPPKRVVSRVWTW